MGEPNVSSSPQLSPLYADNTIVNQTYSRRKIIVLLSLFVANFFFSVTVPLTFTEIFILLERKYNWSLINVTTNKIYVEAFLIYMSFIGGLLLDFMLSKYAIVLLSYLTYILGGVFVFLMNKNTSEDNSVALFREICSFNSSATSSYEVVYCRHFAVMVLLIIGFANGLLLPLLYAYSCDQIRTKGPKYVSIVLLLNYGSHLLGMVVGEFCGHMDVTSVLILYGLSLIVSFLCLSCAFKFGVSYREYAITFSVFLSELRAMILSAVFRVRVNNQRDSDLILVNSFINNGNDKTRTLRLGVYRLMTCVSLVALLILPACILIHLNGFLVMHASPELRDIMNDFLYNQTKVMHASPELGYIMNYSTDIFNAPCGIVLCIVLSLVIYKFYEHDRVISFYRRIFCGTMLIVLAIYYAGIVETVRLKEVDQSYSMDNQDTNKTEPTNFSVSLLLPSFILLGCSEILILVTALEYAYLHSPPWLRYTSLGFIIIPWGSAQLLALLFKYALRRFYNDGDHVDQRNVCYNETIVLPDIDELCSQGHLDYIYYILASVFLLCFILGLICLRFMKPHRLYLPFWDEQVNNVSSSSAAAATLHSARFRRNNNRLHYSLELTDESHTSLVSYSE